MTDIVRLSWDVKPERGVWSAELVASISNRLGDLEAGDPEQFIAGYAALPHSERLRYWAELIVAIAKFESSWKPNVVFHEPPPLGVDSVGLLQLSYEDQPIYNLESLDRNSKSLEDPLVNLRCGVKILSKLLIRDNVVAGTVGGKHRGAARYWSVMREGPKHHLEEIKCLVRKNAMP